MTTLADLIDEVIHNLSGFTQSTDAVATLTNPVGAGDLTISVDNASSFAAGIAEMGQELVYVKTPDAAASTLTITSWGRGYRGTTAAEHVSGTPITMSPRWPRATVAREINHSIVALYPYLYGVKKTTFTHNVTVEGYELPADCVRVLDVKTRPFSSPVGEWDRVREWDVDFAADATDFPSGKSIAIYSGYPGATIQVVYAVKPTPLANPEDDFSLTGLPESAIELVVLGTTARLAPYMDPPRLTTQPAQAREMNELRQVGTAAEVARGFRRDYQTRLIEEKQALDNLYPARYRKVR